jgi:mono/diheme cytochrome c family protein
MPERPVDPALEKATNRWMVWGFVVMILMVLIFPVYRWYEPSSRESARAAQEASLADQGRSLFQVNCVACHGATGEGGIGPALDSKQFLTSVTNDQIESLIATGVPGSQMSAYGQDFNGPLTGEQITALATYLRSWEPTAPDNPNWRTPLGTP